MDKKSPTYTLLDHTADLGVEITGSSLIDLFKGAGETLLHLIFRTRPAEITYTKNILISGNDLPDLMVRWLNEILYLFDGENLVVTNIIIDSLSSADLKATLTATPLDPMAHEIIREIKAATYHQVSVTDENGIWTARVIFDL
jgi:SHS2 domain-containing protein